MGNGAVSKAARQAARKATSTAAEELARRTRANMGDLATFFAAREREEAVAGWLAAKVAGLREQAGARRDQQRRVCGVALGAMRDRGESVGEIARMAGVSENTVRELIRVAKQAPAAKPADTEAEPEPQAAAEPEPAVVVAPATTQEDTVAAQRPGGVGGVVHDGQRR